jgi:hypothetical protein
MLNNLVFCQGRGGVGEGWKTVNEIRDGWGGEGEGILINSILLKLGRGMGDQLLKQNVQRIVNTGV